MYAEEQGGDETPVGVLKGFVPIKSASTDVDAAIASVNAHAVGRKRCNSGTGRAAAQWRFGRGAAGNIVHHCQWGERRYLLQRPGETPGLNMVVAKRGRATGLTCASITAVSLRVKSLITAIALRPTRTTLRPIITSLASRGTTSVTRAIPDRSWWIQPMASLWAFSLRVACRTA